MRRWTNVLAPVATLALVAASAAADDAQQLGPFRVGMTLDEARAATQGAVWEDVMDDNGRVVGAQTTKVWTFDGVAFNADMRHDLGGRGWMLTLTSEPTPDAQKPCRNRLKSLIKFIEATFGALQVPEELRTRVTGGSVTVQRINGYPVVMGVPGTASNVHETYSAGENSQFAAEYEEDDRATWTARTATTKLLDPSATVTATYRLTETNTPSCFVELALRAVRLPARDNAVGETLAAAFEPAFVAEFPAAEADAAREAWKKRGGQILNAVQRDIFPIPDTAEFTANALAALRAKRAAEPSATMDALIEAAFAGWQLPKAGIEVWHDRPKPPVAANADPTKKEPLPNVSVRTVGKTVVVKVAQFKGGAYDAVANALAGVKGDVILDIRGNQGGLFNEIVHTAALFIGLGQVIAKVETRNGVETYKASGIENPRVDLNPVVLVDQETNSGAMMFAAALSDHGRARIAGAAPDRINGRMFSARVLNIYFKDFDGITAVRFPTGVIYRPNGAKLSDGVKLDRPSKAKGDAAITEAAKLFAKPKA